MIFLKFLVTGLFTALLFPPYFFLPIGFIIFPYLTFLILKLDSKSYFLNYFLCGFLYFFGFLSIFLIWIINPFFVYESTKDYAFLSFILIFLISFIFGVSFILFKYINNLFLKIIFLPSLFVCFELLISNFWFGFPWISFALIISNNFIGLFFLKFFGSHFVSFLVIIIYIFPIFFFYRKETYLKKKFLYSVPVFFLIVTISFYIINLNNIVEKKEKNISFEIFQINKPLIIKNEKRSESYKSIISLIKKSEADIIIFAENNFPYIIENKDDLKIGDYLKENQTLIIGATRIEKNKFYNTFVSINKNSVKFFDKKYLVPFGEFLPFRKYLNFMEMIAGSNDYSKGENPRLINISNEISIVPIICYEILFFWKLLDKQNNQSDLLINITNDSWFGKHSGPYQHFYLSKMRAAEFNKPLIRVSNNGISAIINSDGKNLISSNLNEKTRIKYELTFSNKNSYLSYHIYFRILVVILFIFILIISFKKNYEQ